MRGRSAWFAVTVYALALTVAGQGLASAASRAPVCGPAGARTLASDAVARVYVHGGRVFGCAVRGSRSYRLGTASNSFHEGRVGPVALAGVQAAYGLAYYGVDTVSAQVLVRRLSDGHVERRQAAITGSVGAESAEQVEDIVVKRDGSVAWIARSSSIPSGGHVVIEVRKSDQTRRTLLDRAASGIRLHSLRLAGSRLSWRYRSTTRTATLH